MKKPLYDVSDHALVNYLERIKGMDLETIRRQIGRTVQDGIEKGANGVISEGIVYRLQDNAVVTIARKNKVAPGHKKRRGRKPSV